MKRGDGIWLFGIIVYLYYLSGASWLIFAAWLGAGTMVNLWFARAKKRRGLP